MGKKQSNGQVVAPQNKVPKKQIIQWKSYILIIISEDGRYLRICGMGLEWFQAKIATKKKKKKISWHKQETVDVNAASKILQQTTEADVTITLSSHTLSIFTSSRSIKRWSELIIHITYWYLRTTEYLYPRNFSHIASAHKRMCCLYRQRFVYLLTRVFLKQASVKSFG